MAPAFSDMTRRLCFAFSTLRKDVISLSRLFLTKPRSNPELDKVRFDVAISHKAEWTRAKPDLHLLTAPGPGEFSGEKMA